ncbi:uncharacterized protein LOC124806617 [Hydra vulgaris]|uniref:uncharacterized protein LOC124806617 n=1 Tax=Hydra vulgaris TaxID=6087 RepID=UPI0032EA1955
MLDIVKAGRRLMNIKLGTSASTFIPSESQNECQKSTGGSSSLFTIWRVVQVKIQENLLIKDMVQLLVHLIHQRVLHIQMQVKNLHIQYMRVQVLVHLFHRRVSRVKMNVKSQQIQVMVQFSIHLLLWIVLKVKIKVKILQILDMVVTHLLLFFNSLSIWVLLYFYDL